MNADTATGESLRDRKRRQTRERIAEAAFTLFDERGFGEVTVDDIAALAEVGRTTFFRYFGDKEEVVFAQESDTLRELESGDGPALPDLAAALAESRRLVVALCAEARHAAYARLVDKHPELADRHARKLRRYGDRLEQHLLARGTPRSAAVLASQIALACYRTAWRLAGDDADALAREADAAFDAVAEAGPAELS
ncbi:AcrR family transcriptional regulator [Amycolatopsis endophytica]|uniref:AcrR family transcriptional regulator n=1 Tax=Amycolatopsis endophytica TaxID=860233 RepID=A0A853BAF6_9PSEU|nr:TetR/AcrR family transcriptional regulator [Amycolatopsis endophytica]NYI92353.1 AcrR family transcriptional regulator [Amycolatopsis endophytica]